MEITLLQVCSEIIEQLDAYQIDYCLVGGLAASARGRTRATDDVDMVITADVETAISFLRSLSNQQFRPFFPEAELVARTSYILAIEHVSSGITLDLAIGMSGFEQQIVERSEPVQIRKQSIRIATAEDLILMKCLAGRPQDEHDIAGIVAAQFERLDWDYCEKIARELDDAIGIDMTKKILDLRS